MEPMEPKSRTLAPFLLNFGSFLSAVLPQDSDVHGSTMHPSSPLAPLVSLAPMAPMAPMAPLIGSTHWLPGRGFGSCLATCDLCGTSNAPCC